MAVAKVTNFLVRARTVPEEIGPSGATQPG